MRKLFPYLIVTTLFAIFIWFFHHDSLTYRFNPNLVRNYLRSQDIEDPESKIKDRIFVSDNDIYLSAGYLYAKGESPIKYNFQHPPLTKYLFGFSTLVTGNPFWIQIFFGLTILLLTLFLGTKLFKNKLVGFVGAAFLLIDPVFGGMMNEALLDLGQAVFALSYLVLMFFYPGSYILSGVLLGFFAASKFWSTALIIVGLVYFYKLVIKKEKLDYSKILLSFVVGFLVFSATYIKAFTDAGGAFNIFTFLARDLRFMLTHNSSGVFGSPIVLFATGFFAPWWGQGVARAGDWFFLWPVGLWAGVFVGVREFWKSTKNYKLFFFLLPFTYLLLTSTQVPFTRYFILILPVIYLNLASFLLGGRRK